MNAAQRYHALLQSLFCSQFADRRWIYCNVRSSQLTAHIVQWSTTAFCGRICEWPADTDWLPHTPAFQLRTNERQTIPSSSRNFASAAYFLKSFASYDDILIFVHHNNVKKVICKYLVSLRIPLRNYSEYPRYLKDLAAVIAFLSNWKSVSFSTWSLWYMTIVIACDGYPIKLVIATFMTFRMVSD